MKPQKIALLIYCDFGIIIEQMKPAILTTDCPPIALCVAPILSMLALIMANRVITEFKGKKHSQNVTSKKPVTKRRLSATKRLIRLSSDVFVKRQI